MVLVPAVKQAVQIPVLAAGGIAKGRQMLAAMVLGAKVCRWAAASFAVTKPHHI
jgi:NAD(P)H-dependent flavin oxidoreductase YrpB (nitropropane dioxygenase family)